METITLTLILPTGRQTIEGEEIRVFACPLVENDQGYKFRVQAWTGAIKTWDIFAVGIEA